MDDTTLQQRIKYLIEHGGIWDDPLREMREHVRWALWASVAAVLIGLVSLIV